MIFLLWLLELLNLRKKAKYCCYVYYDFTSTKKNTFHTSFSPSFNIHNFFIVSCQEKQSAEAECKQDELNKKNKETKTGNREMKREKKSNRQEWKSKKRGHQ